MSGRIVVHSLEQAQAAVAAAAALGVGVTLMSAAGAGQPAVILESGANWAVNSAVHDPKTIFSNGGPRPGYSWVSIQRALATVTTVCWYDRAGSGWSDPGPYPRDSASQARDLHALLRLGWLANGGKSELVAGIAQAVSAAR